MKAVTQLSKKNLTQTRSRSILIGISIMLTTALLTIIGLSCNGIMKMNSHNSSVLYGDFHAAFTGISEEKKQEISVRGEIEKTGSMSSVATVELGKASGVLSYYDQNARAMSNLKMTGQSRIPTGENEIMVQKSFFKKLMKKKPKIGDTVTVPYRINGEGTVLRKKFTITGFLPDSEMNDLKQAYGAVVSKEFFEKAVPVEQRSYTLCVKMKKADKVTENGLKESINQLAEKLSIPEKNVSLNTIFIMWDTDPGAETVAAGVFIAAVVVLFSIVVIYNIFYVGMIQKVQE